jgi:hypothetical protein
MLLSQQDIQSAGFSFYPLIGKKSSKRQVFLSTKTGVILKGIAIRKKKGERYFSVDVLSVLTITNRPEHGEAEVETLPKLGEVEQILSDLTGEVLRTRLAEYLR